jgi:antibiotic biosynthesis monooxygenase (ABM) superfamily enzyme
MEQEIIKTDKRYRATLFVWYAICLVALSVALALGLRPFKAYMDRLNFYQLMNASELVVVCLLLLFVGPGCYLIVVGRRIIASKRMPYLGQKVIHDTKLIEGKKAVLRGRLLMYLGIFGILLALAGVVRTHYLIEKFRHFNPFEHWNKSARIVGASVRKTDEGLHR